MDVLGRPIDEMGPIGADKAMPIHRDAPSFEELSPSTELLETGIKVIDLICPFAKGGKVGLFGGAGVGKTVTMMELIRNIAHRARRLLGVHRCGRAHARRQRLLPRDEGVATVLDKVAMVYGQMNEPPGNRLRVALTGLTIAENFRDEGRDVLLFIDNIYRLHAGRHRGVRAARPHALRGGLPADAGSRRWASCRNGSLRPRPGRSRRSRRCTCPADDLTDPSPATTFGHLDATVVLSRDIASLGIYPAVDPLDSTSRQLDPHVVGEEHYKTTRARAADAAALQGAARHHRDSRHGRALARGQARVSRGAQDPALPVAAVQRRRSTSPARRASTCRSRTRSRASR